MGPWLCRDASWLGPATTVGRAFVIRGSVLADCWHFRDSLRDGSRSPNLVVTGLAEGVAQPLETLVETVTGGSASRLNVLRGISSIALGVKVAQNIPRHVVGGCEDQACR
jgi:hypothetical protein